MDEFQFQRRLGFLTLFMTCCFLVLIVRMYALQVYEGEHYRALAEGNRIALQPNIPLRGQIFDRMGTPIALNKAVFHLDLFMVKRKELDQAFENLKPWVSFTDEEKADIKKKSLQRKGLDPLRLKDNLSWRDVSAIELNLSHLPGISIGVGYLRYYPQNHQAAHAVGYVSAASPKDQEADPMLEIPGIAVGKTGLEKQLDQSLRGIPGYKQLEVNAARYVVKQLSDEASEPGQDLNLSIDLRLHTYINDLLADHKSASVVVLDVETGEIIAFVSYPAFDPNLFVDGISHSNWRMLMDDAYVPLTNKVVAGVYPPGSTLKMLMALAGLETGVINPNSHFHCPGYMYVGNHKFHCYKKHGHGTMKVADAITQSCDVFFYELSKRIDVDDIHRIYTEFNLGETVLEGFPHERSGLVPTRAWKAKHGGKWTITDNVLISIGQGSMLSTPLQLAVASARLATGKKVVPNFQKGGSGAVFDEMSFDPKTMNLLQKSMMDVVNDQRGTAYRWRLSAQKSNTLLKMAGKTGTSQVRRITLAQRKAGQTKTTGLPWKYREHGLFIGFLSYEDKPRYAFAVVIEHASSSSKAANVARDVALKLEELLIEDGVLQAPKVPEAPKVSVPSTGETVPPSSTVSGTPQAEEEDPWGDSETYEDIPVGELPSEEAPQIDTPTFRGE